MFERLKIKYLGNQPIAEISKETLEKLIQRDFPESYEIVKKKLSLINSDSLKGQNRLSAAVLKVSNANLSKIDSYIEMCNSDYRDVISQAEYPRISEIGFVGIKEIEPSLLKEHYLKDWTEDTNWMNK